MSYNGSGTFQINTSGQPVVAGTVISSTAFNALTADLATGLSTAITKDGQTTTTARIPFAAGINSTLVTDSTNTTSGSIITAGGVGIAKALYVGTTANIAGTTNLAGLTASSAVATDASKNLVSVTNTGTGNNVLATSPTITTPTISGDATINGQTHGKGGGNVATNTAVGTSALAGNSTGARVTAIGHRAGVVNTAGNNAFIGSFAGEANTTGTFNAVLGDAALPANTSGSYNVSCGQGSLNANTTASNNTAVGYQAGYSQVNPAGGNTIFGYQAGYTNVAAYNNTFIGTQAGYTANYTASTTTGNTFVGFQTGYAVTTGTSNTLIGIQAGYGTTNLTTGTNNTLIGAGASTSAGGDTHSITVSCVSVNGKGTGTGFIAPGSASAGAVYQGNNSTLWSVTSDQRLKKNIVDNNTGLDIINQIQVRNFEYRLPEEITDVPQDQAIKKTGVQLGVIAQELQQILPECVKTESTGVMTVDADNLTWYLINAIKELKAEVDSLKAQINGASA